MITLTCALMVYATNMNDMINILITGGCGFIGSELVNRLISDGRNRLWIIDSLHSQVHGENPAEPVYPDKVTFTRGDIRDKALVEEIISEFNPEIIYHLAAETGTGQSMDEVARYCDVNVQGTAILLDAINKYGSDLKKIVVPSSRAIYGEGAYLSGNGDRVIPGCRDELRMKSGSYDHLDAEGQALIPISTPEDVCPNPISIYASTKLMQEYMIEQSGNAKRWNAVFLRLQNVYGPGQSLKNPYTGVLSIFSSQLINGQELNIYEDGEIVRDFIYVTDVVDALIKASSENVPHGIKLNIGSGKPAKMLDVAKILINAIAPDSGKYYISGDYRDGDIRHAIADISLAIKILGWKPKVNLETGLGELAKWSLSVSK